MCRRDSKDQQHINKKRGTFLFKSIFFFLSSFTWTVQMNCVASVRCVNATCNCHVLFTWVHLKSCLDKYTQRQQLRESCCSSGRLREGHLTRQTHHLGSVLYNTWRNTCLPHVPTCVFTVHLHLLDDAIKLIPTLRIDIDGLIGLKGFLVNTSIDLTESE